MQDERCEELGLQRCKADPRKASAVTTFSAGEQEALIEAPVASHVAATPRFLSGPGTQDKIMRANDQFELFLRHFKGPPAASWHACTLDLVLT